jgi:hypothetical protein
LGVLAITEHMRDDHPAGAEIADIVTQLSLDSDRSCSNVSSDRNGLDYLLHTTPVSLLTGDAHPASNADR